MKKKSTKAVAELPRKPDEKKSHSKVKETRTQQSKAEFEQQNDLKSSDDSGKTPTQKETAKSKTRHDAGFGTKVWGFVCSVKLAVIIIIVAAVACIVGTLILQQKTPAEYATRYGKGLAAFLQALQLTDIFHSYWFAALLLLLCTNLTCCTIKRWRNSIMQVGFILTHLSINLILVGAVIGFQYGQKGGVNIPVGQSANFFFGFNDAKKYPLDFSIFCDEFILEKHAPKFELLSYIKSKHLQKTLSTDKGKEQKIPKSRYTVTVMDYIPDAELRQEPIDTSDKIENPAVFVQLYGSEKVAVEGWLVATDRNWYVDRANDFKVEYLWAKSDDELEKMIATTGTPQIPTFSVSLKDKDIKGEYPIEKGKVFNLEGTDYKIKVVQFALDFTNKAKPLQEQQPVNPAVQLEIDGPDGTSKRWVFSNYPDWGEMHSTKYSDLKFNCAIPQSLAFVSNNVRIIQCNDGKQVLAYLGEGKPLHKEILGHEKRYDIGQTGQQLAVSKFYRSFGLKQEVVKISDEVKNPAVFVEIDGPKGKVSDWVFSADEAPTPYIDDNFFLLYKAERESIKDFKSRLRVIEDGKTVLEKTIEVNDPLKYKGYAFYQSSYDPKGGKYTGLQVSRDPGLPVVYAGFGTMCFGIIFIFYIKPFLRKRQKKVG